MKTKSKADAREQPESVSQAQDGASLASTAALIGIVALIEPELLAGMALGASIVMVSKYAPDLFGGILRPVLKTVVKAGYAAAATASEMVAEANEQVQDALAEVQAEMQTEQKPE